MEYHYGRRLISRQNQNDRFSGYAGKLRQKFKPLSEIICKSTTLSSGFNELDRHWAWRDCTGQCDFNWLSSWFSYVLLLLLQVTAWFIAQHLTALYVTGVVSFLFVVDVFKSIGIRQLIELYMLSETSVG